MNENARTPVSSEIENIANQGPAPYIDRFVVSFRGSVVRLGFMEQDHNSGIHHRAAVSMSPENAVELYKLLQEMLLPFEVAIERQAPKE